jgi:SulP family sulfate permease
MALQSYLFFGTANRLHEQVKALLASRLECRFLLFDFRLVVGIDSSATHSFAQIKDAADEKGARLALVNLTPEPQRVFQTNRLHTDSVIVAPDLDRALEFCEVDHRGAPPRRRRGAIVARLAGGRARQRGVR